MQIGEVIRQYRKEQHLTQEQMANRLGVSTPAVNKWENGNSMPDLTLLAPIARLLGINTDTLLSYRNNLSQAEIKAIIQEADIKFRNEPFEAVYGWAKDKIEEYPNCDMLIYQLAQVLDAQCVLGDWFGNSGGQPKRTGSKDNKRKSEAFIQEINRFVTDCYTRLLDSEEETMRYCGASALYYKYFNQEAYDKAQDFLSYFSDQDPEKKRRQACIYAKTNRVHEAYRLYEEILLSSYGRLTLAFNGLFELAKAEGDMDLAAYLADKQTEAAKLFDQGDEWDKSLHLELAVTKKDINQTIDLVEKLLLGFPHQVNSFIQSPLYAHIEKKEVEQGFWENYRRMLKDKFRADPEFAFLKGNPKWEKLMDNKSDTKLPPAKAGGLTHKCVSD
jgi:transcriptional regulator with XRE-family HTH domain